MIMETSPATASYGSVALFKPCLRGPQGEPALRHRLPLFHRWVIDLILNLDRHTDEAEKS